MMLPKLTDSAIEELAFLLQEIDSFTGEWGIVKGITWADESEIVMKARTFLYNNNLVLAFDWGEWSDTFRDIFENNKNGFSEIDKETVSKLLTTIIRADRFNTGFLLSAFKNGKAQALLHRLYDIEKNCS
jgi:hypothetical protein